MYCLQEVVPNNSLCCYQGCAYYQCHLGLAYRHAQARCEILNVRIHTGGGDLRAGAWWAG